MYSTHAEHAIVSAKASVMIYDDATKKWMPAGGGANQISKVQIFQHATYGSFRVVGRKCQGHDVVINCNILRGLKYNQATPTFHQWRDTRQVYGLNFASKEDAEAFAHAMLAALDQLNKQIQNGPELGDYTDHTSRLKDNREEYQHHKRSDSRGREPVYGTISSSGSSQHWENGGNTPPPAVVPQAPPIPRAPAPTSIPAAPVPPPTQSIPTVPAAPAAPPAAPPIANIPQAPPPPAISSAPTPPAAPAAPAAPAPPAAPPAPITQASSANVTAAPPAPEPPSLAAALQNATLRKVKKPDDKGTSNNLEKSEPVSGPAGHGDMLSEMQKKLQKRREIAEGRSDDISQTSNNISNFRRPSLNAASKTNGSESPKPTRVNRLQSLTGQENISMATGAENTSTTDLDGLKQEILTEMRKEIAKMKQDIIEGKLS
ncbi:DgyrCDS10489 [Dimorphilus gyrociliatus]|uniref:DgyrCDS10489 n=1 Tax=Dimorphilus gyrociliatus TaxID=2664684 RepID=A0A7I8W2D2_9ANNE|nr:DgyrCDS10489 [Dimorphilus gyrociliatus]